MGGLAEVLAAHADCGSTVEVHDDRTGTMHYSCGITVSPVRGLVHADRQHLETAVLAWLDDLLGGDEVWEVVARALVTELGLAWPTEAEAMHAEAATAALAAVRALVGSAGGDRDA